MYLVTETDGEASSMNDFRKIANILEREEIKNFQEGSRANCIVGTGAESEIC